MTRWFLQGLVAISSLASAAVAVPVGCNRLDLVLDPRLSPGAVERAWASGQPRSEVPAILELRGCSGELLDRLTLDAPLARLDPTPLRGAPAPTYLVSMDLTAPAGSYSGPLTRLVQVSKGALQRVAATDAHGQRKPIRLALTEKAAWKRVRAGAADDLLSISCQPQGEGFVIFYYRYHPTHLGWQVRVRSEPGFWESDNDFPEPDRFR